MASRAVFARSPPLVVEETSDFLWDTFRAAKGEVPGAEQPWDLS